MENDKPIGMVTLKEKDFKGRPDLNPWLSSLYVDKLHRKKGFGKRLLRETEMLAVREGFQKLYLVTDNAVDFYSELGWHALEQVEQNGLVVTVMETEISIAPH